MSRNGWTTDSKAPLGICPRCGECDGLYKGTSVKEIYILYYYKCMNWYCRANFVVKYPVTLEVRGE